MTWIYAVQPRIKRAYDLYTEHESAKDIQVDLKLRFMVIGRTILPVGAKATGAK
ncbi:MAG: hypothetical protein WCL08_08160 [Verrucomicrobiota bacterium]